MPASIFVPRWRTKISPDFTVAPSDRLIPRYCALESRRFFDEPPAFFLDIVRYTTNNVVSIRQIEKKFKYLVEDDKIFFLILLFFFAFLAFGLGRISINGIPLVLESNTKKSEVALIVSQSAVDDRLTITKEEATPESVVGSRNGTRYYTLDCSGISRIAHENRIYFLGIDQAKAAGYTPSSQCF